jgi:hypothetical protein
VSHLYVCGSSITYSNINTFKTTGISRSVLSELLCHAYTDSPFVVRTLKKELAGEEKKPQAQTLKASSALTC